MEEYKGKYKKKHPEGTEIDQEIAAALRAKATENEIACAEATSVAIAAGKTMADIGRVLDLSEISIIKCQLGLFGYPGRKIVKPAVSVDPKIEAVIKERLSQGHLSCLAAWEIADAFGVARMSIASACETLGVKLASCQLGAF